MIDTVRKIIDEQMGDYGLSDLKIGTVISISPLKIKISDRITLNEEQLLLTEQVLEKKIKLIHNHAIKDVDISSVSHSHSVNGNTVDAGEKPHNHSISLETDVSSHSHSASGGTSSELHLACIIQEGLKINDKVILISAEKNQKFIVLSKVRDKKSVLIDGITSDWSWS